MYPINARPVPLRRKYLPPFRSLLHSTSICVLTNQKWAISHQSANFLLVKQPHSGGQHATSDALTVWLTGQK